MSGHRKFHAELIGKAETNTEEGQTEETDEVRTESLCQSAPRGTFNLTEKKFRNENVSLSLALYIAREGISREFSAVD